MKKMIIAAAFFLLGQNLLLAQQDGYADKFCEVTCFEKLLTAKVTVSVDSGQVTKLTTDTRIKNANGKPVEFYGVIGALDYMSTTGWTFISAFPVSNGNQTVYRFYFRKRVPISEIPKPVKAED